MSSQTSSATDDEAGAIDLTPMLDVVFIMLIFFIVTASFVKEPGVEVNRPDSTTSLLKKNAKILLAINDDNEVWIDKKQYDLNKVADKVKVLYAENPNSAVVIQADNDANVKTIVEITQEVRELGIPEVEVSTEKD